MTEKRPTIRFVSEATGYSKSTVSMALRDDPRIAMDTRRRIQKAAEDSGYRHNPVVSHLMAQLSMTQKQSYKATLAMLNIDSNPDVFNVPGTIRDWVDSCEKRADELGYRVDRFWLEEPGLTATKLARIFRARNITGVLIINSQAAIKLPDAFAPIWKSFSCMVVGNRIAEPALNYVCNDQYFTTLEAVKKVVGMGYKRPGLVMCEHLDENVELKFSAGFQKGHELFCDGPFIPVIAPGKFDVVVFRDWLTTYRPDAVIVINTWPEQWAVQLKKKINLISIDRNPLMRKWPGMDQNNGMIGAVAVEQLIGQIHRNEIGLPPVAKCVLIHSTWKGRGKA